MRICEVDITAPQEGLAGTRGPQVRVLQQALNALGYSLGNTGVDGIYGPRTARAVTQFQQDAGIKVDGDAGPETVGALKKTIKNKKVNVKKPPKQLDLSNSQKAQAILDLIAEPESRGNYDAVYPGRRSPEILDMTLEELYQDQRRRAKRTGSSASGRYQYIRKTLQELAKEMGLDPKTTKFSPKTQDQIALYHLQNYHGLNRWMLGKISSQDFLARLSRTWAGLPDPRTGASFYTGILNNRAGITAKSALGALDQIQGTA